MKGDTEDKVRIALHELEDAIVYKPPDDARNWKPCDFMVWWDAVAEGRVGRPGSAWIEVKDNKQVRGFPLGDLRPSQRQGIAAARDIGLPYWLIVWWRARKVWTISDATKLLAFAAGGTATSVTFEALRSTFGVEAQPGQLGGILRMMLEDE